MLEIQAADTINYNYITCNTKSRTILSLKKSFRILKSVTCNSTWYPTIHTIAMQALSCKENHPIISNDISGATKKLPNFEVTAALPLQIVTSNQVTSHITLNLSKVATCIDAHVLRTCYNLVRTCLRPCNGQEDASPLELHFRCRMSIALLQSQEN